MVTLVLGLVGCGRDYVRCGLGPPHLVATTTDFESGALVVLDPSSGERCDPVASSGPDAVVRAWPGRVVVFDRTGGTSIRLYTPGDYAAPEREIAAPPGANLHDVAELDGELWMTAYERDVLLRVGLDGGALEEVSLADFADADGLPEADRLVVTPGGLHVALQRLDRSAGWASASGVVARVDRDGVAASWEVGPNPKLFADPSDPERLVALTGVFGVLDGGLEVLDPRDGAVEVLLRESDLGYDLDGFAGIGSRGVVLGVEADGTSHLGCLDLASGAAGSDPGGSAGWVEVDPGPGWLVEAVAGDDAVYVAVRTGWEQGAADAVLRVDPETCAVDRVADQFLLDPFAIAWVAGG